MIRTIVGGACIALVGLAAPGGLGAQGTGTAPCAASEHRQFDFWIGSWEVRNPAGGLAGTNVITSELGGCVLREHWEGTSGSIGESFNVYDRRSGEWHQTWVDNSGLLLQLDGGLVDGSMVLEGVVTGPDAQPSRQRVTWTPRDDGSVRQHWESSTDEGATWSTVFDGVYTKVESP